MTKEEFKEKYYHENLAKHFGNGEFKGEKLSLQKLLDNTKSGIMYGEWNDNGRLLTD